MASRTRLTTLFLSLLLLAGCEQRTAFDSLVDIPVPDLSAMDLQPQVAAHLAEQAELATRLKTEADQPRATGRRYGAVGQVYHAYEYYDAAAACYRNAQTLQPQDYRWPYYLGQVHRMQGDSPSAIEQLERALALKPDYAPTAVSLAQLLRQDGRGDDALAILQPVIADDPDNAVAHYVMGQVYSDRGQFDQAVDSLQRALEAQPDATRLHQPLATAKRETGDEAGMEQHLAQIGDGRLRLNDPLMLEVAGLNRSAKAYAEAGAAAFRRGDFDQAVLYLQDSLTLDPDNANVHQALGSAFVKTGDAEQAEFHYREAVRIRPRFAEAHYHLALLIGFLGRTDEAVDHYKIAAQIQPGFRDVVAKFAAGLDQTGRCDPALVAIAESRSMQQLATAHRERCPDLK